MNGAVLRRAATIQVPGVAVSSLALTAALPHGLRAVGLAGRTGGLDRVRRDNAGTQAETRSR